MAFVYQPINADEQPAKQNVSITILFVVFSYNRPDMLSKVVEHVSAYGEVFVVDDASEFNVHNELPQNTHVYIAPKHRGKTGYWQQWNVALEFAKQHTATHVCFMPDDFEGLDVERLINTINGLLPTHPFAINLVNDGREECWIAYQPQSCKINGEPFKKVGFVDCGFIANRATLSITSYKIKPVPMERFAKNNMSSGVGEQLTRNYFGLVNMYLPVKSFAYHGTHLSMMHPEERIKNPLISK
jgi:hypothetical protein